MRRCQGAGQMCLCSVDAVCATRARDTQMRLWLKDAAASASRVPLPRSLVRRRDWWRRVLIRKSNHNASFARHLTINMPHR